MQFKRSSQVGEAIKREVSDIIAHHLKDPRLGFVTVTGVELSDDLRYAKVFVSLMGVPEETSGSLEGLKSAKGFIRSELGKRLRLRYCPEMDFRVDQSISYGDRIDRLINQIHKDESPDDGQ